MRSRSSEVVQEAKSWLSVQGSYIHLLYIMYINHVQRKLAPNILSLS